MERLLIWRAEKRIVKRKLAGERLNKKKQVSGRELFFKGIRLPINYLGDEGKAYKKGFTRKSKIFLFLLQHFFPLICI